MPKLYPAQPIKPMNQIPTPQKSNPLASNPVTQNMGTEPPQGFLGNPQQKPMLPRQTLNSAGWRLGVNIAQQQAASPSMQTHLAIRNAVTQPKMASYDLTRMTQAISRLAVRPIPSSIVQALGL